MAFLVGNALHFAMKALINCAEKAVIKSLYNRIKGYLNSLSNMVWALAPVKLNKTETRPKKV